MKFSRRTIRIILISVIAAVALVVAGGLVASKVARSRIDGLLASSGISIQSLDIDLFTRSMTVRGFEWRKPLELNNGSPAADSSYVAVSIGTIRAAGIDIISFLRRKALHVHSLSISEGKIVGEKIDFKSDRQTSQGNADSVGAEALKKVPFSDITLDYLDINDLHITIRDDTLIEHQGLLKLRLQDIALHEPKRYGDPNSYALANFSVEVSGYKMAAQRSMYTLTADRMTIDSKTGEASINDVVLLPRYGKYRFSRRIGRQVDRFILRIPAISMEGIDLSGIRDSVLTASKLTVSKADLHVFRDKRLPFIKHHNTPLPIALIRSLKFGFALDSLILADTKITYEEFPENGFQTGHIVFDQLQARLAHVSNRSHYPQLRQTVLHVTSRVMQNGMINVDFTLPYDKEQVYNAKGRISNLRLSTLNPLLQSLAFVRVETGRLNALDFNFDYDDFTSRGNIFVNYENLKVAGLAKEKDAEKNTVKSFVLGLFIRKDKDRDVPLERRTGKIYYERDRRRAIFNVWVRSLMSGVKSSVVDAPEERKPLTRKQRRDSLRDVRRERRELKKNN